MYTQLRSALEIHPERRIRLLGITPCSGGIRLPHGTTGHPHPKGWISGMESFCGFVPDSGSQAGQHVLVAAGCIVEFID